jgi:hypothetical protein
MIELQTLESIIENKPEGFLSYRYNYNSPSGITFNRENWRSLDDIQKQIDQLKEIESLRQHLYAWLEKYADLKIKSDANQWAHDNMQEQLASANSKLESSNWYLTHLLEQDCISDCSLVREVETLLSKQLEGKS